MEIYGNTKLAFMPLLTILCVFVKTSNRCTKEKHLVLNGDSFPQARGRRISHVMCLGSKNK